ncbi:MAG: ATP-binding cassette domain-containing protein [Nanoarchaeota archaeon]|nr:ATP-binding cassette domain-containing protein [Nanoarchaeota archaeon]
MKRVCLINVIKNFRIGHTKNEGFLGRALSLFGDHEQTKIITVLKGLSLEIKPGEIVGLIGGNGSGKSTLLRIIAGIYKANSGEVFTNGKIISLINLGAGFQQRLTMRQNIYLCCSLFGIGSRETKRKFNSIVEFAGLKDFIDTKLYQFSSGMQQRLAFSIAIHCNPDILLLDEIFEVGDKDFAAKSDKALKSLVAKGVSIVLVSHNMHLIESKCTRVYWLKNGKIEGSGKPRKVIEKYLKDKSS